MSVSLGIDTGGTYTDAVLLDDARGVVIRTAKALTTRYDLSVGIKNAVELVLPIRVPQIKLISLSSTLATNAIVEGKGSSICLLLIGYDHSVIADRGFEKIVPRWAKAIHDLAERDPTASEDDISLCSAKAFDGEEELWKTFEIKFTELQYGKDTKKIRFALARVLAKLEQECHNKIDYQDYIKGKSYHLDHIEPQDPDVPERRDPFKIGSMDLIESIGNLVILRGQINQSASNLPPAQKISHYLESNGVMPMILCPKERWNIPQANRRNKVEAIQENLNLSLENWSQESIWKRTYFCMTHFASTFTHFSPPPFAMPVFPAASNEGQ